MTEAQRAAIERAEASMAPALELYAERNKLASVYYRLDLTNLKRLNLIIGILTDSELREVADFAEGLAIFRTPESESGDAQIAQQGDPTSSGHPGGAG
jgi:hypothetical protein